MVSLSRVFAVLALCTAPIIAMAQSQFATVATVDGAAITAFEVDQRTRFLRFLRAPGAGPDLALEQLIDDQLRFAAARQAGIELTPEGLDAGIEDFAGRADITVEEFTRRLRAQGIELGTAREFVRAGLTWREVVRSRFGSRAQISDDEIDRALGAGANGTRIRVLLNEIILPARPDRPEEVANSTREAERLQSITSFSRFQAEAGRLSAGPSRDQNGRLNWLELSELPASLGPILLALDRGEVTAPLRTQNAIILFQLRDIEEVAGDPTPPAAIDYAALYLPGGTSAQTQASRIKARIDTCDDLYGEARRMAPEALERGAKPLADIPEDVALELAKLDANEVSTALTRAGGETLVFLMLCSRVPTLSEDGEGTDREAVRQQLRSSRLEGFADGFLAELRAQAVIQIN
ncbi:MAG: peptidylprolyl isomerase [Pseudomonadota bacterium]